MSMFYATLLAINVVGIAVNFSNLRTERERGLPRTGSYICTALCGWGVIWSAANLY